MSPMPDRLEQGDLDQFHSPAPLPPPPIRDEDADDPKEVEVECKKRKKRRRQKDSVETNEDIVQVGRKKRSQKQAAAEQPIPCMQAMVNAEDQERLKKERKHKKYQRS